MKKYKVEYENYSVLFGDNRFSVEVEAENEQEAIGKAQCMKSQYATGNYTATEITEEPEMITLALTREQVSRLSMACLSLMHDFQREARDPDTGEERKHICERSAAMWSGLRDEIRLQAGFEQ